MDNIKACFKDKNVISIFYYLLVILGYVSTLFFRSMRPGVLASVLMMAVFLPILLRKLFIPDCLCDYLVIAFFVYEIISVIWLRMGGFPLSVFASEFVSSVLPMVFYAVGRTIGNKCEKWYRMYLVAMLILGILGTILYVWAPQFYNDWLVALSYTSKADAATTRVRMHSVVGSTSLSFIMVAGMLAASFFYGNYFEIEEDDNQAQNHKRRIIFGTVCFVLCLLFAILANQRSGLVAAAFVIIYVNYLLFFRIKLIDKKYFYWEIACVLVLFALICVVKFDFVLKYWYRIASLPTAISQRSEQWIAAVNNMYSTWLGNGLGANGHRALGIEGAHVVADGGLVKLYCENGVVGFSIWVYIIILALRKGVKNIDRNYAELGIITVGLLQSIGSNMLAFQLCTPIFWFAIGRIFDRKL